MSVIKIIVFTNVLLLGTQLVLTLNRATDGDRIADLNDRLTGLQAQNKDLSVRVYRLSSTTYLLEATKQANFLPVKISSLAPLPVADKTLP